MDDEDLERFRALTKAIAETTIQAYKQRFPAPDRFEVNVIISSTTATLASFLMTLNPLDKYIAIAKIIDTLLEIRDHE